MLRNLITTGVKFAGPSLEFAYVSKRSAGHSKWANIRHIKGAKDAQRSLLFTRLGRMMKVAIQEGGSIDPKQNSKLDQILEQAKRANMPSATVQSIIKSSQLNKSASKSYQLELKGPGSCIILVDVFTDNLHAAKQNISTIMKKHRTKYLDGSGKHFFEEKGIIEAAMPEGSSDEAALLEKATDDAIECGAEDVKIVDDSIQFFCGASNIKNVTNALEKIYKVTNSDIEFIPLRAQELNEDEMALCSKFLEKLEALPEVVRTYDNIL